MLQPLLVFLLGLVVFITIDVLTFSYGWCLDEHVLRPHYYTSIDFPADRYIKESQTNDYRKRVQDGYAVMKTKRIVICLLARNIGNALDLNRQRLEKWGQKFKDYRVLVYENDSVDNTRNNLLQWQSSNNKVFVFPCGLDSDPTLDCRYREKTMYDLGCNSMERMDKMTKLRNIYLHMVKQQFADFDYMMVYDIDISGPFNMDGMAIPFGEKSNHWDAVCANGSAPIPGSLGLFLLHYDLIAYVGQNDMYEGNLPLLSNIKKYMKMLLNNGLTPGQPLYKVKSAFGGCTIYKISSIMHPEIQYGSQYGCEHIYLHKKMDDYGYGNIYINPDALILVGRPGPSGQQLITSDLKHHSPF